MKKSVIALLLMFLIISCELFDNRVDIAKKHVEEQYLLHKDEFPAKMMEFEKTNGENLEGTIWLEPGIHKIYKLYYTATFESQINGFVEVEKTDGSAFPIIFNERNKGLDFRADGSFMFDGYEKQEIKVHDKIQINGVVLLKKTDNGWVYTPE